MKKRTVLLMYTGGTIGMVKDLETGTLVPFNFDDLLNKIPELAQLNCNIATYTFYKPLDSSNIQPSDWVQLAEKIEKEYDKYDGFVILHGSDTMAYTASALSFLLENTHKAIVFTGSQLPISDMRTDAKENLITAIQIASDYNADGTAVVKEVSLYFEYKLYRGNRTSKVNSDHFEAFASLNFPPLAESGVLLNYNKHLFFRPKEKKLKVHNKLNSNVAILKLFPGISEDVIQAIVNIKDLKGLLIETYGSGNAPSQEWFVKSIEKAIQKGITVVNITQCSTGTVNHSLYEVGLQMRKVGVVGGKDMTTEAALTKLMFILAHEEYKQQPKKWMRKNLRGEMK